MTVLGQIEPDPYAAVLATGYERFNSPIGICGLCRYDGGNRLDLLAVAAVTPGRGDFRRFIVAVKACYQTICVWQIDNEFLHAALLRYGFTPETQLSGVGYEVMTGLRWDKK